MLPEFKLLFIGILLELLLGGLEAALILIIKPDTCSNTLHQLIPANRGNQI